MADTADTIRKLAQEGKIEFFSQDGVYAFKELAEDFVWSILGVRALITDKSDLSDFGRRDEKAYAAIEARYKVDVRGKDNLLEIFRLIDQLPKAVQ